MMAGMHTDHPYPGTPHHQALLHQIVTYYQDDPRVRALTLFGSVARGTWDRYADLDLDVVVRDHVQLDVLTEVQALCTTFTNLHEYALLITPDHADAADVVLTSLYQLSIRYHPLATTSPNIVESAYLLYGQLSIEEVKTAGRANVPPTSSVAHDPFDSVVRAALGVNRELHRQHFWLALAALDRLRTLVITTFTEYHGGSRPYHVFQAHAPRALRERLGATLPQPTFHSLQTAFLHLIHIVEHEHAALGRHDPLSHAHATILATIRQRQQHLHFEQQI